MKKLILLLLASVCSYGVWAQAAPYRIFNSYENYTEGIYDTISGLKFDKRSSMSMLMGGGGGYKLNKSGVDTARLGLVDKNAFFIEHGDTLYFNTTQLKKGGRPGYARAIDINGTVYFEANLRGETFTEDADKFGTSAEGKDGIIGAAIKKAEYITRFFTLNPSTMRANNLQTEKFLHMLKKMSPEVHAEYLKTAMGQDDIEALYPSTVWKYLYMLKDNSTKNTNK